MQNTPHTDVFNNPLKPGDYVIYAASLGRSPILKVALILELRTKDRPYFRHPSKLYKVSVRTAHRVGVYSKLLDEYDWELQKKGSPITLEFTSRLLKVPAKSIPVKIRRLLKAK